MTLTCFKTYDIRGRLDDELNEDIAYRIGCAYARCLSPRRVVLGGDVRLTSESLKHAVAQGLMDQGVDVVDIGVVGTEEIYFAAFHLDVDGGIEVTASHNPRDYNGMKLVGRDARPIGGDDLGAIRGLAEANQFPSAVKKGLLTTASILPDYVSHLLGYVDLARLRPLKLVVNAGNGAAGHVVDALEARLRALDAPVEFVKVHHEADGRFPNGIPNPLLPENRAATSVAVKQHGADMGIAWDGDFDRCFLFDERGQFVEGYYVVGLLAEAFLLRYPGEKIVHDPRLTWNTVDIVTRRGGVPIQSKTGHAFMKERLRAENAIYGGEMSAHHYFRSFHYCDSGMIPWLLTAGLMSSKHMALSDLVGQAIRAYPCSGEINYDLHDAPGVLAQIEAVYGPRAKRVDHIDGLSVDMGSWRFNVRASNTEPLLRLNVESRRDAGLVERGVAELEAMIKKVT